MRIPLNYIQCIHTITHTLQIRSLYSYCKIILPSDMDGRKESLKTETNKRTDFVKKSIQNLLRK